MLMGILKFINFMFKMVTIQIKEIRWPWGDCHLHTAAEIQAEPTQRDFPHEQRFVLVAGQCQ